MKLFEEKIKMANLINENLQVFYILYQIDF